MPVLAIDGPSGAGKSSVSKALAQTFGWEYLDTGALYRALTLFAIENEISEPSAIPELLPSSDVQWLGNPRQPEIRLANRLINEEIRAEKVTERVSAIAANSQVRAYLLLLQRSIINQAKRGIVVEGRDIGTTVWPDAELKIFLTADLQARAERRNAELQENFSDGEVEISLARRDAIDSTRSASPLRQSEDQITVDATHLTLEQVVSLIAQQVIELKLNSDSDSDD